MDTSLTMDRWLDDQMVMNWVLDQVWCLQIALTIFQTQKLSDSDQACLQAAIRLLLLLHLEFLVEAHMLSSSSQAWSTARGQNTSPFILSVGAPPLIERQSYYLLSLRCLKVTAVPVRRNGNFQTPISVPAVRPKRCHTLSNPTHRQDYMLACLNYTLQTMMPLPGWPVVAPNAYDNNNNN